MSSNLNFHTARSIAMEAVAGDGYWAVGIEFVDDPHLKNHHKVTAFVSKEDFPSFQRAVEAFNAAMARSGAFTED